METIGFVGPGKQPSPLDAPPTPHTSDSLSKRTILQPTPPGIGGTPRRNEQQRLWRTHAQPYCVPALKSCLEWWAAPGPTPSPIYGPLAPAGAVSWSSPGDRERSTSGQWFPRQAAPGHAHGSPHLRAPARRRQRVPVGGTAEAP